MKTVVTILFLFIVGAVYSQSESESDTVQVRDKNLDKERPSYGYQGCSYFFESDMANRATIDYRSLDTTLNNLHVYEGLSPSDSIELDYQDLGNIGTAKRSLYDFGARESGIQLGLDAYSSYAFKFSEIKYFDVKSPYSKLNYVQGGKGQQVFEVALSRNIDYRWNIGIDFKRIVSKQQAGSSFEENHTNSYGFLAFSSYRSKNEKYRLLLNYLHFNHFVTELGGGVIDSGLTKTSLFDFDNVQYQLGSIETKNNQNQVHLYQEYQLAKRLYLTNSFERNRTKYEYTDEDTESNLGFYQYYYGSDTSSIFQKVRYDRYSLNGGLKYADSNTVLTGYVRSNVYDYDHINSISSSWANQSFVGGRLQLTGGKVEFYGNGEVSFDNNMLIQSGVKVQNVQLFGRYIKSSPTLIQQYFNSELLQWTNNFVNPSQLSFKGKYSGTWRFLRFEPSFDVNWFTDYIYFSESGTPVQETEQISTVQAKIKIGTSFGKWRLQNSLVYFKSSNNVIRAPEFYNHTRFYFESIMYKSRFQLGFDAYVKSSWEPYFFNPVSQQFDVQNSFTAESYLIGDLFFNINIKWANVFLKVKHINQGLMSEPGYFVSPNYTGMQRIFVFGIKWEFFD